VIDLLERELREKEKTFPPPGTPVSLSEAERRYGLLQETIGRWCRKGYIRVLQKPVARGAEKLVDEHDVARCAAIFARRRGRGSWIMRQVLGAGSLRSDTG